MTELFLDNYLGVRLTYSPPLVAQESVHIKGNLSL